MPARLNAGSALLREPATGRDEAIACLGPAFAWSYQELDRIVGKLAALLSEDMGLIPGNRVLLRGPNSPMLLATILAVLRAGGVVVPTMPLLRPGELAQAMSLTQPNLVLCDISAAEAIAEQVAKHSSTTRFCLYGGPDTELERILAMTRLSRPEVSTAREDPALILFSSGSTGKPKAAVHTHGDILAVARSFGQHIFRAGPGDIVTGTPSLAFAYGFGLMLACPLAAAATIRLYPERGTQALADVLSDGDTSLLVTAPTAYRKLLGRPEPIRCDRLRRCFSAGEPLPPAVVESWRSRTGLGVVDVLGSTEMLGPYVAATETPVPPGCLGKPVPGYELKAVGPEGWDTGHGRSGRLAVRGPTGCCYLDSREQRRIMVDGWVLTGDVGRLENDGYIAFEGRADDMILSAGYTVSAVEVETVLSLHPAVGECAVAALPDAERGSSVVALVVPQEEPTIDEALAETLKNHLKESLALYKTPRRIIFVDSLPKTPTGKLRRTALASLLEQYIE